jgi:hypothetical protein
MQALPRLPFPLLKSLTVTNYKSVDVSGLFSLRSLSAEECRQINGKGEIFLRLTSLSGWQATLAGDNMKDYPNLRYKPMPQTNYLIFSLPKPRKFASFLHFDESCSWSSPCGKSSQRNLFILAIRRNVFSVLQLIS